MKAGVQWLLRLHGRKRGERTAQAYKTIFDKREMLARLVLADLAHYCRVGQSSFVPNDPYQTMFNEGARDVFLHIAELVGLVPDDFPQFIEEAINDR